MSAVDGLESKVPTRVPVARHAVDLECRIPGLSTWAILGYKWSLFNLPLATRIGFDCTVADT